MISAHHKPEQVWFDEQENDAQLARHPKLENSAAETADA